MSTVARSVDEGGSLQLECQVEDTIGIVAFQWKREEEGALERVQISEKYTIVTSVNRSVLSLNAATANDNQLYFCIAQDSVSRITKVFNVSVKGK